MDRERKVLYVVAVLAPIVVAGVLKAYYDNQELIVRSNAAIVEANQCHKQLVRAWAQCASRPLRNPQEL